MTDYEPYLQDAAEPVPPPRLAAWRARLAWLSAMLVVVALAFLWLQASGSEDPSLNVPVDQLTPSAPPAGDPAAPPPSDPAAQPTA